MAENPKTYDKEAALQRTKELTDKLESGIKDLFSSDKYKEYLKAMSHFHNYSSRNIMLINIQMPGATRVASFKLWDKKFNRRVKKGEKGIRIFAPVATKEKKEFEKLDPETKAPLLDKNGRVIMETLESDTLRFKLVPVFDVSQTHGDPLPELVENLTGDVAQYEAFLDTLKAVSPLPIAFEPLADNNDGYCRFGEKIGIREGMSEVQTISAVIHEIAHARLHDREKSSETSKKKSKDRKEVEAESVSYVVCQHYGIETAANSFGYLAEWGSRDMSEFQASLDTIRKEANSLINAIDDHFKVICKDRGSEFSLRENGSASRRTLHPVPIDLTAKEQEAAMPEKPSKPEFTTEQRTENIAGVDFTFEDVVPVTPQKEVETPVSLDPSISISERSEYGYTYEDMLPMTQEKALEMYDADHIVYLLYPDETEAMAIERSDIENFDGIFGMETDDWEKSKDYEVLSAENSEAKNAVFTRSAVNSNYKNVVALVGVDDKIYLGNSENYHFISPIVMPWHKPDQEYGDGQSYYDNADNSLLFVSDNKKMYSLLYGDGLVVSQEEAIRQGAYSVTDFKEFAKLQKDVLKDLPYKDGFDGIKFGGKAFVSPFDEMQRSMDCASAIGKAINENYDGYRLSSSAANLVIEQYGTERVNLVLANTLQYKHYDGRFSRENKDWAQTFDISEMQIPMEQRAYYISDAHPAVLDGFLRQVRKITDEQKEKKPSVLETLKTNAEKSRQIGVPTKEPTTKNNGLEM